MLDLNQVSFYFCFESSFTLIRINQINMNSWNLSTFSSHPFIFIILKTHFSFFIHFQTFISLNFNISPTFNLHHQHHFHWSSSNLHLLSIENSKELLNKQYGNCPGPSFLPPPIPTKKTTKVWANKGNENDLSKLKVKVIISNWFVPACGYTSFTPNFFVILHKVDHLIFRTISSIYIRFSWIKVMIKNIMSQKKLEHWKWTFYDPLSIKSCWNF